MAPGKNLVPVMVMLTGLPELTPASAVIPVTEGGSLPIVNCTLGTRGQSDAAGLVPDQESGSPSPLLVQYHIALSPPGIE